MAEDTRVTCEDLATGETESAVITIKTEGP